MLKYKNRLIKNKDFALAHQSGAFFSFGSVAIKCRRNNLLETRIGISVGLKFSKKAVERNALKRQLREIFRKKIAEMEKGWDVVVMVRKKGPEKIEFSQLEPMVEKVLNKSNLLFS